MHLLTERPSWDGKVNSLPHRHRRYNEQKRLGASFFFSKGGRRCELYRQALYKFSSGSLSMWHLFDSTSVKPLQRGVILRDLVQVLTEVDHRLCPKGRMQSSQCANPSNSRRESLRRLLRLDDRPQVFCCAAKSANEMPG